MSRPYSPAARRNLLATSAQADLVVCLEITHPDLVVPVRVVNDSQNMTVVVNQGGAPVEVEFIACPFDLVLPDDVDGQVPKATLRVDNIGRELTQWLEYSRGGKGARVRILQALRSYGGQHKAPEFGPYATDSFAEDYAHGIDIDEWRPFELDMALDMSSIEIDNLAVSSELGYQNTLMLPAVAVRYDPKTSPGVF
uniref:DUF1833 family protein n=1 Tax=Castellaniella defragrans TaxID=75697 RepID=UPI003340FE0B